MFLRTILAALFISLAITAHEEPQQGQAAKVRAHRSTAARRAFKRLHPCPSTGESAGRGPGYVIDHIIPLACGGPDKPENMQWQTVEDTREKDKTERQDCGNYSPINSSHTRPQARCHCKSDNRTAR
jgi:hypothetical protein